MLTFVIGPSWNNLNTLLNTIEKNKSILSSDNINFYLPTNDRNVEKYFKENEYNNIKCLFFSENQGHQLSCYNSIIAGMKMVIDDEKYSNDIVIFSHEDCYINNIELFNEATSKILSGYEIVCRKYNGIIVGNEDYYMNDTFLIKKNIIKLIFESINIKPYIENGYFCEKYFTELINTYNIFYIPYTHSTWGDTELGFYHIPSIKINTNILWDKLNIRNIYNTTLTKIGLKYNTDKSYFHLFTEFYNDYFEKYRDKNINILEMGIFTGLSLQMLAEYFPKATIYAIDINEEYVNNANNYKKNIIAYQCNQIDFVKLQELFQHMKFDIIIDDGSHITSHQQKSLGFFFPYLNKEGIYICEDLHTSYDNNYIDTSMTTLQILEEYNNIKSININLLDKDENKYLNDNINEVNIYYRNQNAFKCYECSNLNNENLEYCICGVDLSPRNKSISSIITHI
jgi:hypothetical protein